MACNCNCNVIRATSVAVTTPEEGEPYITITVPDTVTFSENCLSIGLFTTVPSSISCARIEVTNGTDTVDILKCDGDYWRPCQLKCRSILDCAVLSDPSHLLIRRVRR